MFVCSTFLILKLNILESDIEFVGTWLEFVTQIATSSVLESQMLSKQAFETIFEFSISKNKFSEHFVKKLLRHI